MCALKSTNHGITKKNNFLSFLCIFILKDMKKRKIVLLSEKSYIFWIFIDLFLLAAFFEKFLAHKSRDFD